MKKEEIKNNNKKILTTFIIVVFCLGLGATGMYYYLKSIPVPTTINKLEKEVTVNENGIADAVEKVYDSVVIVKIYQNNTLYATGTGFIFKKDGNKYYILTNNHLVEDCTSVKVELTNDNEEEVTLVGTDKYIDTAVLSFTSNNEYSVANIGSSNNARVGDTVFTVGAPINSSKYSWTVTRGILSGKDRMVTVSTTNSNVADYVMRSLQTDAAINSGNSGGPLCNSNGEIIGITNMKLVADSIEGMSFAIPIEDAMDFAEKLIKGEDISKPFMGVSTYDVSQAQGVYYNYGIRIPSGIEEGVIVIETQKDSPADKAGLQKGDVIIEINNKKITNAAEMKYELYKYKVGDKITIKYNRNGTEKQATLTLSKLD